MTRQRHYLFGATPNLAAEVGAACERGHIWLAYQPIVDSAGGQIHSAEVLLRWNHPVLGALLPGSFVPILEESGAIHALGEWVLRQACFQARQWQNCGLELNKVSVNVSPSQLREPGFHGKVERALQDSELDPGALILEVTENVLIDNAEQTLEGLHRLTRLGVGLHIDDFGTGFSSIAYLKRLPLTAVKVDRGFISGIESDSRDRELVRWMIQLGQIFGFETIAEGVETAVTGRLVQDMGVTRMQGFLYGAGVSAAEFERRHLREPCGLT